MEDLYYMTLVDMLFWFFIIWFISLGCRELYVRSSSFKRAIFNVIAFIGVFVHELGHTLMCILFRVPFTGFSVRIRQGNKISPHGRVTLKNPNRNSFLQDFMVTFGPLFLSTWVFLLCLDMIWVQGVDIVIGILLIGIMVSVVFGASPSRPDLNGMFHAYSNNPSYSTYQLLLAVLSIIIVYFTIDFPAIIYLPMELFYYIVVFFTVVFVYYLLKYFFRLISHILKKAFKISITSTKRLTRRRHKPSKHYNYEYQKILREFDSK